MATSPHRIHHDLYRGPKILKDPGNGGIIRANADLQICEMASGGSGETRTLANPTKPGIRLVLRLLTDGGGNVVVTAPNGLNANLETEATFADASDIMELLSVTLVANTSYRWEDLSASGLSSGGVVVSSATPSSSPSTSASASASTSPSASASGTPSTSPSASASTSPSTSPSASVSTSPSAT